MIGSVTVVGLGRLGTPIAVAIAARGVRVVGVDLDRSKMKALDERRLLWVEPGVSEMWDSAAERLSTEDTLPAAVASTDAVSVIVPTPSDESGGFTLRYILAACEEIGRGIAEHPGRPVVSIASTVLPGSTWGEIRGALEAASGRVAGEGFGLCYSPEFVALGSVVRNFLRPDFVLIGQSDELSGSELEDLYSRVCENDPPIKRMSVVNAEITKLALNTFVTTKIAFGNMLAEFCEAVEGGDADVVADALGSDRRIGPAGLRGGLGYGGPCFPRDNIALATFARSIGASPLIPEATDEANRVHFDHVRQLVRSKVREGAREERRVAVLGLSYKPETDVTERSHALELALELTAEGISVRACDPAAGRAVKAESGSKLEVVDSAAECVKGASVVVLATPWSVFVEELNEALEDAARDVIVIDCWRSLDPQRLPRGVGYVALGKGPSAV